MRQLRLLPLFLLLALAAPWATAEEPAPAERIVISSWLGLPGLDGGGRAPFNRSAAFERYLWKPDAPTPAEGDEVTGASGRKGRWAKVEANEKGVVPARGIAMAHAMLDMPEAGIWLAEIHRASVLYVNGAPHAGDVYGHGITKTPVRLRKGPNHLYVAGFRGRFRFALEEAPKPVFLASWDATLPDVVPGETCARSAGVLVVNASEEPVEGLVVTADVVHDGPAAATAPSATAQRVVDLPPLGTLKVALPSLPVPVPEADAPEKAALVVGLRRGDHTLDERMYVLPVRKPGDAFRFTFRSKIDGSIQFYGVRKPKGPARDGQQIVLSLHGAGVDALNQARAYSARDGFWVLAATNRRPFGFDWQDWGRADAYEVMDDAIRREGFPRRVHVTGHSMGGHGTWHLAANDPDRFLSAAPSAGWMSFDTYGSRPQGALTRLWHAADGASLTDRLLRNLAPLPIYVLHGSKDDNVPPSEAQRFERLLKPKAKDITFTYVEGKKHWWDGDAAPGADCVDWPGFFEMFARAKDETPTAIDWIAPDLSLDAQHHWIRLQQPLEQGAPLEVKGRVAMEGPGRVEIETRNVRRFRLSEELSRMPRARGVIVIDGQEIAVRPQDDQGRWDRRGIAFLKGPQGWLPTTRNVPWHQKRPDRQGPFKRAFDREFVLVYGTAGDEAENEATLQKARYDAEQWRYRANGRAVCLTDRQYLDRADVLKGRNVILYGNADTNAAWNEVFDATCPIRPSRGSVKAGARTFEGDAYGVLLVYPKKGDPESLAAAVAGTGVPGTRLGFRLPTFVSGVGIPDFVVFGPEVMSRGDEGVRAAGFFDVTWQIANR